jgi:hypothetical protein
MTNLIYESQVEMLAKEETNRLEQFRAAWEAYYGNLPKPLKVKPGNVDDNIRLNFIKLIVNKGVSFLFGKEVGFELAEGGEISAETWLKDCWQKNRKMTLLQKAALNGGVCGHCFVKIQVDAKSSYPRLIVVDPETITVTMAADDLENVQSYKIQYPSKDPKSGKPIAIRQIIEKENTYWHIKDQVGSVENLGHWVTTSEQNWSYSFPPIVECQNLPAPNEFWGMSDIEPDILEINKAINFSVSNTGRILKYHAHPKTWGKGFSADQLKIAVDETIIIPSETGELHNLEMQTELSSSIEFYNRLKEALHETSQTPEVAMGKLESIGGLSGLALKILYGPLLEKTETKRLLYGDMLIELNRRLLEIGGHGADNITKLHWQDILPKDEKQERETALVDKQLGVSDDTLLTQLGYDPETEKEKKQKDSATLASSLLGAFDKGE